MLSKDPQKRFALILAVVALLCVLALLYPFLSNPTSVTKAYDSAGPLAPVMFILLVMIAPTPGAIIGASGGAYFGVWIGAFLLFIGNMLGVTFTFLLVRAFGRPAAQRFIRADKLASADGFLRRHPVMQWVVYAIPLFPLELATFVIALSDRQFKRFFITVLTALPLYSLIVTLVGSQLEYQYRSAFEYASLAILVVMAVATLHFFYRWKHEEIHATGRRLKESVDEGVQNVGTQVRRQVRRMRKP